MLVNVRHVATRQLWVVFSSVDITATINLQLDDRACLDQGRHRWLACKCRQWQRLTSVGGSSPAAFLPAERPPQTFIQNAPLR